jgi:hypothetical protein
MEEAAAKVKEGAELASKMTSATSQALRLLSTRTAMRLGVTNKATIAQSLVTVEAGMAAVLDVVPTVMEEEVVNDSWGHWLPLCY